MLMGEMRKKLDCVEDEEPLTFYLERTRRDWLGREKKERIEMKFDGASSTAGGRAAILWFDELKR